MRILVLITLAFGCVVSNATFVIAADRDKENAIKQERKKYEGTWRVILLQVDGNVAPEKDAKKITVVNQADGTWSIQLEGKEIAKGTSEINPTSKPKTIDFTPTEGSDKGRVFLGIYDIRETCRKLCYAPAGKDRPTEFFSKPGSGHVLVIFQREKPRAKSSWLKWMQIAQESIFGDE
jgi:uncharacterized protein (TIGR03067 family)